MGLTRVLVQREDTVLHEGVPTELGMCFSSRHELEGVDAPFSFDR